MNRSAIFSLILATRRPPDFTSVPAAYQRPPPPPLSGHRRCSTATAAAASPLRRLVISRRVWQAHEKTLPKVKPKPQADSSDDKPWPQSVRIAGAVVGGIFIPYSIVWFITSNPSLRDMFQDYLPMDRLRTHFGEVEWGAQSYVDTQMDKEANVVKEAGLYQFPGEITWKDRKQQEIVEKMEASKVTANAELKQTKQVPVPTRANRKVLSELIQYYRHEGRRRRSRGRF